MPHNIDTIQPTPLGADDGLRTAFNPMCESFGFFTVKRHGLAKPDTIDRRNANGIINTTAAGFMRHTAHHFALQSHT